MSQIICIIHEISTITKNGTAIKDVTFSKSVYQKNDFQKNVYQIK